MAYPGHRVSGILMPEIEGKFPAARVTGNETPEFYMAKCMKVQDLNPQPSRYKSDTATNWTIKAITCQQKW